MTVLRKDENTTKAPEEHPLFSGKSSVGMISGENPRWPAQASGHEAMGEAIKNLGLKGEPQLGRYGSPEKSWMVYGPTREQMFKLGRLFGQDSVVYSNSGQHELLYTNGPNIGRFHPGVGHEWFTDEPEDFYTHMPKYGGFLRLKFDWDTLHPSKLVQNLAIDAQQLRAQHGDDSAMAEHNTGNFRKALADTIKKALIANTPQPRFHPHPHAYEWHNEHTDHHLQVGAPGVVLVSASDLNKSATHGSDHPTGVSTYAKYAMPYGVIDKSGSSDLYHYPYHGKNEEIDRLVNDHGYGVYYAGGKHGRPDLANRNYNTKHLMIPDSGIDGTDFGAEAYTDGWRKIHELSHALTSSEINKIYGEGRRARGLGQHRTLREALRAVHWEWLATHKQRDLSEQIGVHIPEHVFNRELNTVMHDAVHRAVTGRVVEPVGAGFRPFEHKVPLETALGMVRESAHNLGITGMHDLIRKSEEDRMSDSRIHQPQEWRQALAKAIKDRVDAYGKEMLALRQRELKKSIDPGPAPEMTPLDMCPLCGMEDMPGKCKCLSGPLAPMSKNCGSPVMDKRGRSDGDGEAGYGNVGKAEPGGKKTVHCSGCNKDVLARENGEPDGHYLGNTGVLCGRGKGSAKGTYPDHMNKGEFTDKPKEPVKTQAGSGGKITRMNIKKYDFGMSDGPNGKGKASTLPTAPAPATASKPKFGLSDLAAGKAKLASAGVKPISPLAAPKPAAPSPAATPGAKPTAPSATPAVATPKLPKPMGKAEFKPGLPATHSSGTPRANCDSKLNGKKCLRTGEHNVHHTPGDEPGSIRTWTNEGADSTATPIKPIKKSELGQCALCKKDEHAGSCA